MSDSSESSSIPIVAILGAVALSVAVFFAFTLPSSKKKGEREAAEGGATEVGGGGEAEEAQGVGESAINEPPVEPVDPGPAPVEVEKYKTASALLRGLVAKITEGDLAAVEAMVGEEVLASPRALGFMHAIGDGGYVPASGDAFAEIGDVDERNRWAMYVVPKTSVAVGGGAVERHRINFDLVKDPAVGWKVDGLHVPSELRQAAVAAGVTLPDGSAVDGSIDLDRADPLFVADDFVSALLSQNFEKALALCGDNVPDEKIAGLCMVFEEGEFAMLKEKPLTTTSLGADKAAAWVFARVRSEKLETNGEFAVELKRDAEKGWEVENVNIESMLQDFVKGSEAGRVPYTPIKTNPDGGETLVLYFEYDQADLLPRSMRQIDILARILKADPKKTLNIGGHADALGTDEYNRKLSESRALSVRQALVMFGVPESQILVTAYGEAKPWKRNTTEDGTDNPEGRQHNRRAEIYLNF